MLSNRQHPVAELLVFEIYSHSSPENNRNYSKKQAKEQMSVFMRLYDWS